jgi:hypothetical protein
MTWNDESERHSLARKGVRTVLQKQNTNIKYKMYHGTTVNNYKKILKTGKLNNPFITNDFSDAEDWSKITSKFKHTTPVLLELEVPKIYIETKCRIDPQLLDERYFMTYEDYDAENNIDLVQLSYNHMDKLKQKNIDWVDWTMENINAFECTDNIPKSWIKKVYIMDDYNTDLNYGHWKELK